MVTFRFDNFKIKHLCKYSFVTQPDYPSLLLDINYIRKFEI